MSFETMETTRKKMENKLFAGTPKRGIDVLKRTDYVTDDDYLDAVARYDLERESPEYQRAYRAAQAEMKARAEEEQNTAMTAIMEEHKKTVVLDGFDTKTAEQNARTKTKEDLANGKIGASEIGDTIEKHYKAEVEHIKATKAYNASMNDMLRGIWRGSKIR